MPKNLPDGIRYAENTQSEPPSSPNANAAPNGNGPDKAAPAANASPAAKAEEKVDVSKKLSISGVLIKYRDDGFLDKYLRKREGRTLDMESRNCAIMLEHFNGQPWDELLPPVWDNYKEWRVKRLSPYELEQIEKAKQRMKAGLPRKKKKKKKKNTEVRTKHRTVDQERNTMVNAYRYAIRRGWIDINRAKNLPKFQPASEVRHCREFCPHDAEELHRIAILLFSHRSTEVLGWQLLFEAYTALRTEEILMLRTDAKPDQPGFIRPDGNMDVFRTKEGANPYVFIHEGLRALLKAHAVWKAVRYPKSPWFFPGERIQIACQLTLELWLTPSGAFVPRSAAK